MGQIKIRVYDKDGTELDASRLHVEPVQDGWIYDQEDDDIVSDYTAGAQTESASTPGR